MFFCELAFLFLSFVIYQDIHDNQWYDAKIAKFFLLVGITGFFQALYGMLQFGLAKTLMVDLTTVKTVLRGTFGPSNAYGAFIGIGIFSIIYISLSKKCYAKTMIAILPICLGAFLLNRSRGAWFSLLLSLVIFIFLLNAYKLKTFMCRKKWFRNKIIMYSLLVIILGAGLISLFYFLYRMDLGSSCGRLYALRIALQMIKDNPVCGIGVGQFEKYFLLTQKSFLQEPQHAQWIHHAAALQTPNNHYVLTLCESGFVGLILQFSLIVISFKYLVKNLKDNNTCTAILCFLLIFAVHALFDSIFLSIPLKLLFLTALCLLPMKRYTFFLSRQRFVIANFLVLFLSVTLCAFIFFRVKATIPAYRAWSRGNNYLKKDLYTDAIFEYDKALDVLQDRNELLSRKCVALIGLGHYHQVISLLSDFTDKETNVNVLLELGLSSLKVNRLQEAEKYAMQAHTLFPDHLRAQLLLSIIYYEQGDIKKSKWYLNNCIEEKTRIKSELTAAISDYCTSLQAQMCFDQGTPHHNKSLSIKTSNLVPILFDL